MPPKYCQYFNNGINFLTTGLSYCNKVWNDNVWEKSLLLPYSRNCIDKFIEQRNKLIEEMKNGNAPKYCEKCIYLKNIEDYSQIDDKINNIEIYHWHQCNCACFYCSNRKYTKLKITRWKKINGTTKVLPKLRELKKRGLFAQKVHVTTVGGEPTILGEFKDILKFFIENKFDVSILSNGILYENLISESINTNIDSYLTISLDCGCKETFKKIKGVDKFDDVVNNIKKYINDTKENSYRVMVKYILLEGVNDNKEEINKWIDICTQIGVRNFFITTEFCHSARSEKDISDNICEMYKYTKQRIKEINSNNIVSTYDFVEQFIEKKSYKLVSY